MEALRQMLAVMVVFALLGLALWKLRRAGIPAVRPPGTGTGGLAGWLRVASGLSRYAMAARGRTGTVESRRARAFERPMERPLERMDRLALTPQHMLHLVRVQGREWVVATHPQGCAWLPSGLPGVLPSGGLERDAAASPAEMVS